MAYTRRATPQVGVEFNVDSPRSIESFVDSSVDTVLKHGEHLVQTDPSRVRYLRISSFPFCARQWFLNLPNSMAHRRSETTLTTFFTGVGHAVHHALQEGLSHISDPFHRLEDSKIRLPGKAVLVQAWSCMTCKTRTNFGPHPSECIVCGSKRFTGFSGSETSVTYSTHVLGHLDGTFAYPRSKDEPYSNKWSHIPYDFKTCSKAVLEASGKLPYWGNRDQLLSYGAIQHSKGYNVPGVCLIYVCRDNPFKRKTIYIPLDPKAQLRKIDGYERAFVQARAARTVEEGMALPQRTKTDFDTKCDHCNFKAGCSTASLSGNTKTLKHQMEVTARFLRNRINVREFPEF